MPVYGRDVVAPSVTVSQWHDTDEWTPAPFFCMMRQLTIVTAKPLPHTHTTMSSV